MAHGLFGKLPARRDFISVKVPRAFLTPWEDWLQAGLSASQDMLGDDWHAAYASAPIWRFWLGPVVSGETAVGAFMPSQDGVGRSYPLTLVAFGDLAPPEYHPREDWFAAAEAVLLSAREHDRDYASTLAAVEQLAPAPEGWPQACPDASRQASADVPGGVVLQERSAATPGTFAHLRIGARNRLFAGCTFWWTAGNAACGPAALVCTGMPDPSLFSALITGRWPLAADGG